MDTAGRAADRSMRALNEEKVSLTNANNSLKKKLAEVTAERNTLIEESVRAKEQVRAFEANRASQEEQRKAEQKDLRAERKALDARVEAVEERVRETARQRDEEAAEKARALSELAATAAQKAAGETLAERSAASWAEERRAMQGRLDAAEARVEKLGREKDAVQAERAKALEQLAAVTAEKSVLEELSRQFREANALLEAQAATIRKECEGQIAAMHARECGAVEQLAVVKAERDGLQEVVRHAEARSEAARQAADGERAKNEALRESTKAAEATAEAAATELGDQQSAHRVRCQMAEAKAAAAQARTDELLEEQRAEVQRKAIAEVEKKATEELRRRDEADREAAAAAVQQKLDKAEAANKEAGEREESLKRELASAHERLAVLDAEKRGSDEVIRRLEADLAGVRGERLADMREEARREIGNAEERCREAASEAVGEGLRILGRTFEEHWPEQWLQLMEQNPLLSPASRLRTAAATAETPARRLYE
jgi:hypothetical protein